MPYSITFTLARKCSYAEMYFPSPNRIYKQWFFVPVSVSEWYFPSWIGQTSNVLPNTFIIRTTFTFDLFGSSFVSYMWALAGCSRFHRFPQNRFSQKLSPSSLQKSPHSPPPPRRRYPPPPPRYELRAANIRVLKTRETCLSAKFEFKLIIMLKINMCGNLSQLLLALNSKT